ncbi:Maf family protein [Jongsikchunia kroppenstedtii]|uniref:Maf family protein n=1 Tax=Jongsikchunia kroppenstedtii TaxID=1121721 RepID=UPI00035CC0BB|nr:Maf family protein [Jongsikchunia kroppenstedtii]
MLASASPARLRVLRGAGINPMVRVSAVDEDAIIDRLGPSANPASVVTTLAEAKARDVRSRFADVGAAAIIVGCDSMLLHHGTLTGKPHTPDRAAAQWRELRGGTAELITGHCVLTETATVVATAATTIRFADIDDATIDAYVATGEPLEVAGAFTLDGLGGWLIDGIDGDPSSVIGISLPLIRQLLARLDVRVVDLWLGSNQAG